MNHGKFSISVVVVSCPPAATHPAKKPSNMIGFRFALAAYIAAVLPAGHHHIITTFSIYTWGIK